MPLIVYIFFQTVDKFELFNFPEVVWQGPFGYARKSPSSSSSTNFIATQVLNKTSGPLLSILLEI